MNELAQFYRLGIEAAWLTVHEPLASRAGALVRDARAGLSSMAFLLDLSWDVPSTTPFDIQAFRRQLVGCPQDCRTSFEIGCLVGLLGDVQDGGVTRSASRDAVLGVAEDLRALTRPTGLGATVEEGLALFLQHIGTRRGAAQLEALETAIAHAQRIAPEPFPPKTGFREDNCGARVGRRYSTAFTIRAYDIAADRPVAGGALGGVGV